MKTAPVVELRDIRKSFGGTHALRGVTFSADSDEVTALVGENGAGKTTLLNVLSGSLAADAGEIRLHGKPVALRSPRASQDAGIAIIHQELSVLVHLSVAENIFLSHLPMRGPMIDWHRLHMECRDLLDRLHVELDLRTPVGQLSLDRKSVV